MEPTKLYTLIAIIGGIVLVLCMIAIGPTITSLASQGIPALTQGVNELTNSAGTILSTSSELYKGALNGATNALNAGVGAVGSITSNGLSTMNHILGSQLSAMNSIASSGAGIISTAGTTAMKSLGDVMSGAGELNKIGNTVSASVMQAGFGVMGNAASHMGTMLESTGKAAGMLGTGVEAMANTAGKLSDSAATVSSSMSTVMQSSAAAANTMLQMGISMPVHAIIAGGTQVIKFLATPIHTMTSAISTISSVISTISGNIGNISGFMSTISGAFPRGISSFIMDTVVGNFSQISTAIANMIKDIITSEGCTLIGVVILTKAVCHKSDCEINTEDGWIKIEDLKVGQKVATLNGTFETVKYVRKSIADEVILYDFTTGSHPIPIENGIGCYILPSSFSYLDMRTIQVPQGTLIQMEKDVELVTIETEGPCHTYECRKDNMTGKFRDISLVDGKGRASSIIMNKILEKYQKIPDLIDRFTEDVMKTLVEQIQEILTKSIDRESLTAEDVVNNLRLYNSIDTRTTFESRFRSDKMYLFFYIIYGIIYLFENYISYESLLNIDMNVPILEEILN